MGKLSKTARRSGATGNVKSRGPQRSNQKYKRGHRAHKRDSVVIPPAAEGKGRDARKAAKRKALAEARAMAALEVATAPEVL